MLKKVIILRASFLCLYLFSVVTTLRVQGSEKVYKRYMRKETLIIGVSVVALSLLMYLVIRNKKTGIEEIQFNSEYVPLSEEETLINREKYVKLEKYDPDVLENLINNATVSDKDTQDFEGYGLEGPGVGNLWCHYAENVRFFYGLCDTDERDLGWACAWRSIQTCLSSYSLFYTLSSLSGQFRQDKDKVEEWAEPGYFYRILNGANIAAEVWLYNRERGTDKTSNHRGTIHSFSGLTSKFKDHFVKYKTPVMIDDVSCAYAVLGIKKLKNRNVVLWIADSHKKSRQEGLYYLELDEDGNKIVCTGTDYEDHAKNGLETAQRINIQNSTGWLLLFPQGTRSS